MENFDCGLCLYSSEGEEYSFRCGLVMQGREIVDFYRKDNHPATAILGQEFMKRMEGGMDAEEYLVVWIRDKKEVYDILVKLIPYFAKSQRRKFNDVEPFFRSEKIHRYFNVRNCLGASKSVTILP
jgi:hypothetical protein